MNQGATAFLINGDFQAVLPPNDRGLAYGDGLFETIAVIQGTPCLWVEHMLRLQLGCERLRIPPPDTDLLAGELSRLAAGTTGVAKLILTRGAGGRGYAPPLELDLQPHRIFSFTPSDRLPPSRQAEPIQAMLSSCPLSINPCLAGIKHLNRLEQVMAAAEARDQGYDEALMADADGYLIEGSCSNLFLLCQDIWLTPRLDRAGVMGILRSTVLEACDQLDIAVEEREISSSLLAQASAAFLCNALWGIRPLGSVGDQILDPGLIDGRLLDKVWQMAFQDSL